MPLPERARRLTSAVYVFCRNGDRGASPELFEDCSTQCAGYAYVLRGLLEATGARTRGVDLYNIPMQGNHDAVEVEEAPGRWAFYDPTFGAYFTENGRADGRGLSIEEVVRGEHALAGAVLQADERLTDWATAPLEKLFGGRFEHRFMSLEAYRKAEWIGVEDPEHLVSLDIPLRASNGSVSFGTLVVDGSGARLEQEWLRQTNATLNDADPLNDTSFQASWLDNRAGPRQTTITISDLEPQRRYTLRLLVLAERPGERLQVAALGQGTRLDLPVELPVPPGQRVVQGTFVPLRSSAQFVVRTVERDGWLRLFGVAVEPE